MVDIEFLEIKKRKTVVHQLKGFLMTISVFAQVEQKSDKLFQDQSPLKIKLSYFNDVIRQDTDDTTYVKTNMSFWNENQWNELEVSLRARGNFRRSKCYFPPIKMKIKKIQIGRIII
jgi:hypothetical protein